MTNIFNNDFLEFIGCLNRHNVRYILVGGYSVILHGYPRTTGDLDIWVEPNEANYNRLKGAFDEFKLPVFDMTLGNFLDIKNFDVFRFGRNPMAIDIITNLKGLEFNDSLAGMETKTFESVEIKFIGYQDLIRAKKASGRPKDINDIENLER